MAIGAKKGGVREAEENVFWTTMADLMLGLSIVFMTLFVLAMTGFTQETIKMQETQMKASEEIVEKLKEADIDAEVDKLTGNVKISDLQLFELNREKLIWISSFQFILIQYIQKKFSKIILQILLCKDILIRIHLRA